MKQGGFVEAVTVRGDYWILHKPDVFARIALDSDGATKRAEVRDANNMAYWTKLIANGDRDLACFIRGYARDSGVPA